MTDRPILFSAPMVRALLDGRKTQTRRVLTKKSAHDALAVFGRSFLLLPGNADLVGYAAGDRLWVREAWHAARSLDGTPPRDILRDADIEHAATARSYAEIGLKGKLRPGMFLPRWASRLTLIVTDVRVQRLQEISEEDAVAEGVERDSDGWLDYLMPATQCCGTARDSYRTLWDSLNAKRGHEWDANPWVVALTFQVFKGNIDELGEVEP